MKRQLTESQKQESAQRKAKFAAIVKQLATLSDADRIRLLGDAPIVTCEGHALSLRNQQLLALQSNIIPTVVGGFRQWLKQGRCVRKGEHGFSILVPSTRKVSEKAAAALGLGPDQPDETFFVTGTVFDISQTEVLGPAGALGEPHAIEEPAAA